MNKSTIEQLVLEIRDWEMEAGEGYCDYFFDQYSYDGRWRKFMIEKGFQSVVDQMDNDRYQLNDGTFLPCTDQGLKFEPYTSAFEMGSGKWCDEVYLKDVALWAEFLLKHEDIYNDHKGFLVEYFE